PRARGSQDQRANPARVSQRELLRHHPAEGLPVDVGLSRAEMVQESRGVVDERGHRFGLIGLVRPAVAPEVESDHLMALGEARDVATPSGDVPAQPLQEEQRGPVGRAAELEVQTAPVGTFDVRHQGEGANVSMMAWWFWEIRSAAGPIQVPPRMIRSAASAKPSTRSRHSSGGPATARVSTMGRATSAIRWKSPWAKARRSGS